MKGELASMGSRLPIIIFKPEAIYETYPNNNSRICYNA